MANATQPYTLKDQDYLDLWKFSSEGIIESKH